MRAVILSDTHNQHGQLQLPAGDLLIHCGDATERGTEAEVLDFLEWFAAQPHRHKVWVPGNHDEHAERALMDPSAGWDLEWWKRGVSILVGSFLPVAGLRLYGAPWRPRPAWVKASTPTTGRHAAFGVMPDQIAARWEDVPTPPKEAAVDILITHVPPAGIGDRVYSQPTKPRIGCPELRARTFLARPRLHVFGHVHDDFGMAVMNGTTFVNAAMCDHESMIWRRPIEVDITSEGLHFPFPPQPCSAVEGDVFGPLDGR